MKLIYLLFITVITFFTALILPNTVSASILSISPSQTNVYVGSNISVTVRFNTGAEPVNAVAAHLSYPVDLLEVTSVTPGSTFNMGPNPSYGGGVIKIDKASINAVTGSVSIATIGFKTKQAGSAKITFLASSAAPKTSDNTNSLTGSSGSTIVINPATPKPTPDTTYPKISDLKVAESGTDYFILSWKTDLKSDSFVEYGLESGKYLLTSNNTELVTDHQVRIENKQLPVGTKLYARVKSKNAAGNETVSDPLLVQLKGYLLRLKVVDSQNQPVKNLKVFLYSDPLESTTDEEGIATFENIHSGKHLVLIKRDNLEESHEINVTGDSDIQKPVELNLTFNGTGNKSEENNQNSFNLYYLVGLAVVVVFITGAFILYKKISSSRNKIKSLLVEKEDSQIEDK